MKRKLSILLTAVATLAVLTACGNGSSTTTTDTEAPAPTQETVAETPAPTEDLADVVEDLSTVTEEEVASGPVLYDTFVQLITDENLNGMTGEFLVDYLVNYESDPAGYDAQMTELFGAGYDDKDTFAATNPELVERGIERIKTIHNSGRQEVFCFSYVDHNLDTPLPRLADHTFNEADWDVMAANWVEGETTYEEIVAELGDPGVFDDLTYYPSQGILNVDIGWNLMTENGNYKMISLEFYSNGVLDAK